LSGPATGHRRLYRHEARGVIRYLFGRVGNVQFSFKPHHEIKTLGGRPREWEARGDDPQFHLRQHRWLPALKGWYLLEMRIEGAPARGVAKFYFDFGAGLSEVHAVSLPFQTGKTAKRLVFFPAPPRLMRFDPMESLGRFTIPKLAFVPVSARFAETRMLAKLHRKTHEFKRLDNEAVSRRIRLEAEKLDMSYIDHLSRLYDNTFVGKSAQLEYSEWLARQEVRDTEHEREMLARIDAAARMPTFSVLMPVYNPNEEHLRAALDSVLRQSYPHWELCIADDASSLPHVARVLREYQRRDARVRVVFRSANGHISAASNSALDIAEADFAALMDHDDELAEHALLFMAVALAEDPALKILYSDEDKIDEQGKRTEPHFKPDWNPDLLLSQNYVSHLGVYDRRLLLDIGGFRAGVEGSQDYDLLLRCLPRIRAEQIRHVPRVLYHWRMAAGSTARASAEKSYTTEAGLKALVDYFTTQGRTDVEVTRGLVANTYRVRYHPPDPTPLVSLLIPTRDNRALLETCVRSILEKTRYPNYEIIILDNQSVEADTLRFFTDISAESARVRVLAYDHPFNYSAINNFGVKHARGEYIGLINNDIEVISPDWLDEMIGHAHRPEVGCVGAKLYYDDLSIQHAGVILGIGGVANHAHKFSTRTAPGYFARLLCVQNFSAVTGACLIVAKQLYQEVGGLNETNLPVAFNDIDFCLRVRQAGYKIVWTPYAELYHHESKSRGADDSPEKQARFQSETEYMKATWGDWLNNDPYYNPNLARNKTDYSLREF
jgi:GT2 family glycosyltransferase